MPNKDARPSAVRPDHVAACWQGVPDRILSALLRSWPETDRNAVFGKDGLTGCNVARWFDLGQASGSYAAFADLTGIPKRTNAKPVWKLDQVMAAACQCTSTSLGNEDADNDDGRSAAIRPDDSYDGAGKRLRQMRGRKVCRGFPKPLSLVRYVACVATIREGGTRCLHFTVAGTGFTNWTRRR